MSNELTAREKTNELQKQLVAPNVSRWIAEVTPRTFQEYLTPQRVTKIVIAAVSRNPRLLQCSQTSIIKSVAELCSLGIEPGGPLQQGYLVPRKNKVVWECMPIVSYRGLITLLRRSGQFKSVSANCVYANDTFEIDLASGQRPKHIPYMQGDRGALIAAYSIAEFADGGAHMDMMTRYDVERVRKTSSSGNSECGPWAKHFDEMAKKTVIRRASKMWPMSSEEMSRAEALDARESDAATFDVLDVPREVQEIDIEGEVIEATAEPQAATDALLADMDKSNGKRQRATGAM